MGWTAVRRNTALGLAAALLAAPCAAAQGEIRALRIGGHDTYDRVVLELGPAPVNARQLPGEPLAIELEAAPPSLSRPLQRRLAALGVTLEPTARGTRLAVTGGRAAAAFALGAAGEDATSAGLRIVLDVARGSAPLAPPPGAQPLPGAAPAAPSALTPGRSPAAAAHVVLGTEPAPDSARTPGRTGEDDARRLRPRAEKARPEEVAVRVGSIEFDGLPAGAPSADELLELDVAVAQNESGDLQGASAPSAQRLRLRELAGGETAPRLDGSLLQAIVERIADEYAARGRYGTRIGIQKRALQELVDGRTAALHIQIEAPPGAP